MQKKKGSLLSFRPDIKVVDATIRDGGLVNNFHFTEDFIKDLYAANVAAGVDYMNSVRGNFAKKKTSVISLAITIRI